MPIEVFIASDPTDRSLLGEFMTQLGNLIRQGTITVWCDETMLAGSNQEQERMLHLNQAQLIVLLISANFINSRPYPRLLQQALTRNRTDQTPVIPILLRPTDIVGAPFAGLVLLPRDNRAVTQWPTHDEAFENIVKDLRQPLATLQRGTSPDRQTRHREQTSFWNVPRWNPYFIGRKELLKRLRKTLTENQKVTFTHPVAISGLGGMGKTQIATAYAYHHRNDYQHVFWVRAKTRQELLTDLTSIAEYLDLPKQQEANHTFTVEYAHLPEQHEGDKAKRDTLQAVKQWLKTHSSWLLILDDIDDLTLVRDYLPQDSTGHVLLTTNTHAPSNIARDFPVTIMSTEESILFLLRRANIIAQNALPDTASIAERAAAADLVKKLGGIPLALDQAGAYIEENQYSISRYLLLYEQEYTKLLNQRGGLNAEHPASVATTWSLSFSKIKPAAAALLQFCSFLAPEAIPEEILTKGASHLGSRLQLAVTNQLKLDAIIRELLKYSLVNRDAKAHTLTMHQLLQVVLRERMSKKTQRMWAERAVKAVNAAFSSIEYETWSRCDRLLPHAQVCAALVQQWDLTFPEAARLLNQTGYFLKNRVANYQDALPLLQRALAIREQMLGQGHPHTAISLINLAELYRALGQYKDALPLLQRAITIHEQVFGQEHPDITQSLNNLAGLYYDLGQYEEALPLLQRALTIREQVLGPQHYDTALSLNNLAFLYEKLGRYEDALPLYQRALGIRQQGLGQEHPKTATSLNNLASLYVSLGQYEDALPLYQKAVALFEKVLGPHHPNTVTVRENYTSSLQEVQQRQQFQE